ncbi:MAG: aminotransferase class I/II-fold pyridoxal phosphate-dependent enzyme [Litorimonas sp.]
MTKFSFMDDYSEGCHPDILAAMAETNMSQQSAYGVDEYSNQARVLIHEHLKNAASEIFFVAGGTLANLTLMSSLLRSHEAIISVRRGHIATHETGAIEAVGHKIITVETPDGKLNPALVEAAVAANSMAPHMAKPRLVYISNATETGRIYTKAELEALSKTCRELSLLLFLDGARLGVALASMDNDVTLSDIARLTDVFWIGGTKAGALIGEAIVINRPELAVDFRYHIKQRGALLAKGRLLGLQFRELFDKNLFVAASRHANSLATKLSEAIQSAGYELASGTQTNQVFPILPNKIVEKLEADFGFYRWETHGSDYTCIRLVTSWATPAEQVDRFISQI